MNADSKDNIVYLTDFSDILSDEYADCISHTICTGGSATFRYNDREFTMGGNDIVVIAQHKNVEKLAFSEDFRCELIIAPDKLLHSLLPANNYSIQGRVSLFSNPIIKVNSREAQTFRRDLQNIRERIGDSGHNFYNEMIGSLLQTMMYDLFHFHSRCNENVLTTNRVGYITTRFFSLIEAGRPRIRREVSHYAAELKVTPKYLSDTIKRVSGLSVLDHINRAATNIIIAYLKDNTMSITQIADEMRFTSLSYFSRYCKKHIGMSPAAFRTAGAK